MRDVFLLLNNLVKYECKISNASWFQGQYSQTEKIDVYWDSELSPHPNSRCNATLRKNWI